MLYFCAFIYCVSGMEKEGNRMQVALNMELIVVLQTRLFITFA